MPLANVLYRAHATATGVRDDRAVVLENNLELKLTTPPELGGAGGAGVNPEQLFAAGYCACFLGALRFVAVREKVAIPADASVEGTVSIGPIWNGFGIEVALLISLPGLDRWVAQKLVDAADVVCAYSNAIRNNIEVTITLR